MKNMNTPENSYGCHFFEIDLWMFSYLTDIFLWLLLLCTYSYVLTFVGHFDVIIISILRLDTKFS